MKVYCVFSVESPHQGNFNVYTQYTISIIKRKSPKIILNLQLWDFFPGTQRQVRNSRGKRAISVPATEVLLYCFLLVVTTQLSLFVYVGLLTVFIVTLQQY